MLATQSSVGFVRDESIYFVAADSYAGWFRLLFTDPGYALSDAAISRAFDINHEHPVLMKTLFGLSHGLFHDALGWLGHAAAYRVPAFAVAGLIPALIYLFGTSLYGQRAGAMGALIFFLVPRQFFHAHLACFDMPIAAMWLLTVYTFWRAQTDRRWWIYCGIAFGLSMATKHNAFFLPVFLAPFALYQAWSATAADPSARQTLERFVALYALIAGLYGVLAITLGTQFADKFELLSPQTCLFLALVVGSAVLLRQLSSQNDAAFRALGTLGAMAALGPVIFYLHWPYLWHHPVSRTAWYLAFHAQHNNYTWFYLGQLLRDPPFPLAYVIVVTAMTVPASLLIPMAWGWLALLGRVAARLTRRYREVWTPVSWSELLIGAHAIASIAVISHPDVPHFGGVKHWFPSMPFLAILGGRSLSQVVETITSWVRSRAPSVRPSWVAAGLFACVGTPALIATARAHPYGTSAYAELAGGVPGAASLGMQRQFWSNNVTGVLDWLNQHAPPGSRVYFHEVTGYAIQQYFANDLLRRDLRPVGGPNDADFVAYQYHQEFREHEFNAWQALGTQKPVAGVYLDETPQVVVYRRQ